MLFYIIDTDFVNNECIYHEETIHVDSILEAVETVKDRYGDYDTVTKIYSGTVLGYPKLGLNVHILRGE